MAAGGATDGPRPADGGELAPGFPRPLGVSTEYCFRLRPGPVLATRYLPRRPIPVFDISREHLPHLSGRRIALALRRYPRFLDRADVNFPIVVAGHRWYQTALDGRHRNSKAIWTDVPSLPTGRVPWVFALEILVPPGYLGEWLCPVSLRELRRSGRAGRRGPG